MGIRGWLRGRPGKVELEMSAEEKERFTEPIIMASRPGTLAGLSLTVLRFSAGDLGTG